MKTIETIFQSVEKPELGFLIQVSEKKKTKKGEKNVHVWIDEYEGGEAYLTDWDFLESFDSFDEAKQYIIDNYGEIVDFEP